VPPPVSLLVIDVDRFKAINDTYSHTAGDEVLRELGTILHAHCRTGQDTAIRYAGDEFVVFLDGDLATAVEVAHRIRAAVASSAVFAHITPGTTVSISTGAATLRPTMTTADLFRAADANLYQAKRSGRDRVAA
jgi:diguanylate cyclase